jgi:hypothetical protein
LWNAVWKGDTDVVLLARQFSDVHPEDFAVLDVMVFEDVGFSFWRIIPFVCGSFQTITWNFYRVRSRTRLGDGLRSFL